MNTSSAASFIHCNDIAVGDLCCGLHFFLKSGHVTGHGLERHDAIHGLLCGAVNRAPSTSADLGFDPVSTQRLAN